jgi:hypothetical protein
LARELDIPRPTIDNYRKRYDIPVFKRGPNLRGYRPIRLSLFTDPQSDSDAYWIGFLAADGTVRYHGYHGGHWDLSVRLKASDAPHLAKLCTALETNTPVRAIYKRFIEVVCRFTSGSPLMVDDLTAVLSQYSVRVGRRYENTPRTHVLPTAAARSNIIAFAHLLYDGAEVSLDRKRALFEEAFEAWGER